MVKDSNLDIPTPKGCGFRRAYEFKDLTMRGQ